MKKKYRENITKEIDRKVYKTHYEVDDDIITVYGDYNNIATQLGSMSPKTVANSLMHELINKGELKSKGEV